VSRTSRLPDNSVVAKITVRLTQPTMDYLEKAGSKLGTDSHTETVALILQMLATKDRVASK
jgi:hypothetical protein